MDRETLKKKTVAELKEMAREIPDIKGLSSMKKDDLVDLLAGSGTGSKREAVKPPAAGAGVLLDKSELKRRIHTLKDDKREAISKQDRARSRECNRQIHRYKRRLRKLAKGKSKK